MLQAIVGGMLKGTKLTSLSGTAVRPTSARVREAVFNILQHSIKGASFIDVCAGNGGMGIEAISRGARAVTFVEKDSKAVKVIKANLDHCESRYRASAFAEDSPWPSTTVEPRDAFRLVPGAAFDIVWLDPPYQLYSSRATELLALAESLVSPEGVIFLESDLAGSEALLAAKNAKDAEQEQGQPWQHTQRRYGKCIITTLQPPPADVQ